MAKVHMDDQENHKEGRAHIGGTYACDLHRHDGFPFLGFLLVSFRARTPPRIFVLEDTIFLLFPPIRERRFTSLECRLPTRGLDMLPQVECVFIDYMMYTLLTRERNYIRREVQAQSCDTS